MQTPIDRESNVVELPDGRRLAYAEYGDPEGDPVLYCHGFPGSRLEARLFDNPAQAHRLRVISADRCGLGGSDPKPGRRLQDWAADVEALMDRLGIARFFLIGVSGGGPYAAACAHRLQDRLDGFTLVCPLGPIEQPALLHAMRWYAQLNFRSIRMLPHLMDFAYRYSIIPLAHTWPQWIYQMMLGMAPPVDSAVRRRPRVRSVITASLKEATRQGADGVLQEMKLYTDPWNFDPSEIAVPVHLWHGTADETVPIVHSRKLAELLPACTTHYIEGEGHFSLPFENMEQIMEQLLANRLDKRKARKRDR